MKCSTIKSTWIVFTAFFLLSLALSCKLFKPRQTVFSPSDNRTDLPLSVGYVNDFEEIFTKAEEEELTRIIADHEKKTSNEIAIATIRTYAPFASLKDYTVELHNYWGVGKKEKNNGVVMVLGKEIRQIYISNGAGVINMLSDEQTKDIIDQVMIPEFKAGRYFEGTKLGLQTIVTTLEK